jgi:hypothetical protein
MSNETPKFVKAEWVGASKKSLFDLHNTLIAKLNSESITTTSDVAATKATEINITSANSIAGDMDGIRSSVQNTMDAIAVMSEQYSSLNVSITAKRTELKDILGFEVEANSAIALVTAKDAMLAEKAAEAVTIIATAKSEAKDIVSAASQEASDMKATQAKSKAEWEYDFARSSKASKDELQDTLDLRIKAVDERVAEVSAREDVADARDERIATLEDQLATLEESIVERIAAAIDAEKASIAKSAATAKSFSDRAHTQDLAMKDVTIDGLTEKVTDISSQLTKSTELISKANDSVADMARAALTSQGDANTIAKVAEVAAGAGGKGR